jgi:hypothetical protein
MKVSVALTIDVDEDMLAVAAELRGVPLNVALEELAATLEGRAVDACRWADGVIRVGSTVQASTDAVDAK